MIIVKLQGGLGNQMFQYAVGRNLSIKHNTDLALDLSFYNKRHENITPREFCINILNINAKTATKKDIGVFFPKKKQDFYKIKIIELLYPVKIINEPSDHTISTEFNNTSKYTYISGYWQSELYFNHIYEILKKDFTFNIPIGGKTREYLNQIQNSNSVGIHIRRGDYVLNKEIHKTHGICGPDYYEKAIEYINKKVNNPHFYVFSDDMNWVKNNLNSSHKTTYVEIPEKENTLNDLQLMQNCKHNIIANSSFSWWGAWLNNNPNKIVIAPQKWFNDSSRNCENIVPELWIKI